MYTKNSTTPDTLRAVHSLIRAHLNAAVFVLDYSAMADGLSHQSTYLREKYYK